MQKKFLSGLLVLLVLNLLIKPFWILGIERTVQNMVGAADYGFYFALLNFSFLFNIFLDLGLTNFNNRNIAQNHHLLNKYFSGIIGIKLLLSALYILVTLTVGLVIGYGSDHLQLLFVLAFNQVLISLVLYLRSNISGLHLFKTDSLISVLDRFLMIVFCSALIWGHWFGRGITIQWFVYAQTVAYGVTAIVAFLVVVRKAKFIRINWDLRFFVIILKQSFPYALLVLLMTFYNRIDSVMLERLLDEKIGAYQTGIYAAAFRLLDALNMIPYLFAVVLLPLFARMIKLQQKVDEIAKLSFSMLFVFSMITAFASVAFRREMVAMLNPQHAQESLAQFYDRIDQTSFVFAMLMSCFVAISITYIFGTLLTANGSLRMLNLMATGGMALNILLNFVLIPKYMASGSAMATVITQFATALVQMAIAIKLFKVKIRYFEMIRLGAFVALLFVWLYGLQLIDFRWDAKVVAFGLASVATALVLKVIDLRNILRNFSLHDLLGKR